MPFRIKLICLLSVVAFITECTKVEFTNPIDPKGSNYAGDSLAMDDNNNGIANMYDPTSTHFIRDTDKPVIVLLGNNPDTIYLVKDRKDLFDNDVNKLMAQYNAYDTSDKTVSNEDVDVKSFVYERAAPNYKIEYSVKDTSNNFTKVFRTVVVIDAVPKDENAPVITPVNQLVIADTVFIEIGDTISDYSRYITVRDIEERTSTFVLGQNLIITGNVDVNVPKVYPVTYTATDTSNNSSSYTLFFKVQNDGNEDTPPIINVTYNNRSVNPLTDTLKDTLPDVSFDTLLFAYEAYDMVAGVRVDLDNVEFSSNVKTTLPGNYTANFRVQDNQGSERRVVINIKIYKDISTICDTVPIITLIGEPIIELKVGDVFIEPGYSAKNNLGNANLTSSVTVFPTIVNTSSPDTITITYSVENSCGNSSTKERIVRIVSESHVGDTTPPVIVLKHSKSHDTVSVGTTYSQYSPRDTGNTVSDTKDIMNWGDVRIISTAFKTTTAGAPCSLIYIATDEDDNSDTVVRKIVVIESGTEGLLEKYGVPISTKLDNITPQKIFTSVTVEGDGPTLTNISLTVNWDNSQYGGLWSFAFTNNNQYVDLKAPKSTNTFNSAQPTLTLINCGVSGLDGEYYVVYDGTSFVWVATDGSFAVVWE